MVQTDVDDRFFKSRTLPINHQLKSSINRQLKAEYVMNFDDFLALEQKPRISFTDYDVLLLIGLIKNTIDFL